MVDLDRAGAPDERWLRELTHLPTATGREARVVAWIERWVEERPHLILERDPVGNLVIRSEHEPKNDHPPVYVTGHLDHPAFVVERAISPHAVQAVFRGGVMEDFFEDAPVRFYDQGDGVHAGRVVERLEDEVSTTGKVYLIEFETDADALAVGDVGRWALPEPEIDDDGILHTDACDDLAAVTAALRAMDIRSTERDGEPLRLLFTRAEEIGFIGAIAACKHATMPTGSRVIALENSRAFPDSPIGGGPIVRVGDRLSIFSPRLTAAISHRAEAITGRSAQPKASEKTPEGSTPWQRKLMAGGACEATVFCAYGYEATCLCLPLGNYHNMAHLSELQARTYDRERLGPPRAAREFISTSDYHGLVSLLVALGEEIPSATAQMERLERLHTTRGSVLTEK